MILNASGFSLVGVNRQALYLLVFITVNYREKVSNTMAAYTSKQLIIDTDIRPFEYTINSVLKNENDGTFLVFNN